MGAYLVGLNYLSCRAILTWSCAIIGKKYPAAWISLAANARLNHRSAAYLD
jgi:hypothetical protein